MSTSLSTDTQIKNAVRYSAYDFSFIKTLADFTNNREFGLGYYNNADDDSNLVTIDKDSYVWAALSAVGEDVGDVLYTNVAHYIDMASNIDLCKIKSLRSMISSVGLEYSIFNSLEFLPLEVAQVFDVMSINKKYLMSADVLNKKLFDDLSANVTESYTYEDLNTGDIKTIDIFKQDKYADYLSSIYYNLLSSMAYKRYDETDTNSPYVYEEISATLLDKDDTTKSQQNTDIYKEYKVRYSINLSFNPSNIVDDIDSGKDSIDNYTGAELELINMEKQRREEPYSLSKPYTRYKYYTEKQVQEYFKFIENKIFNDNEVFSGNQYNINRNFILLENTNKKYLLNYVVDEDGNLTLSLDDDMIRSVANTLATMTIYVSEIRDKIKTQTQRNYIKGTFNLLSYVINEYLIGFALTDKFKTEASADIENMKSDPTLSSFAYSFDFNGVAVPIFDNIRKNLSTHILDDVKIKEYDDVTEYYNLSTSNTPLAENKRYAKTPYWLEKHDDDAEQTTTMTGFAFKASEIEKYYMDILGLRSKTISSSTDLDNFLNLIYETGADKSYTDSSGQVVADNDFIKDEIYLNYHGTEIGYTPYYNHKNVTHSSYQVHPYLYNLVEHTQLNYPVTNTFFNDINDQTIGELTLANLSNFIGEYGQTIKIWINSNYDYSGYKTRYESIPHTEHYDNITHTNEVVGYDGAFYPKATEELYSHDSNSVEFISMVDSVRNQTIEDENGNRTFYGKYYVHLNLTPQECEYIADQLQEYYDAITGIILRDTSDIRDVNDRRYDIYKYGRDRFDNNYILYKSYIHPSEYESLNWNSFDSLDNNKALSKSKEALNDIHLNYGDIGRNNRENYAEVMRNTVGELWIRFADHPIAFPAFYGRFPQVDIEKNIINGRIEQLANESATAPDGVNPMEDDAYHMGYFYDMEFDTSNRTLFLMACPWGNDIKNSDYRLTDVQRWDKADVIISDIDYAFDIQKRRNILKLKDDIDADIDGIDCVNSQDGNIFFKGIAKADDGVRIVFANEAIGGVTFGTFQHYDYTRHVPFIKKTITLDFSQYINGETILEDSLNNFRFGFADGKYLMVVLTNQSERLITSFAGGSNSGYLSATEKHKDSGEYNSFDSLNVGLYLANMEMNGDTFVIQTMKEYNLNSDASYLPSYAGKIGKNDIANNGYLSLKDLHNIELLGNTQNHISDYIDYICKNYGITEDDTEDLDSNLMYDLSAIEKQLYGRVYEDYAGTYVLEKSISFYANPLLNVYKTDYYDPISTRFSWTIELNEKFPNLIDTTLSDFNILVFNSNTYGKNPYYKGKLSSLYSETYDEDLGLFEYFDADDHPQSEIQSDLSSNVYVGGSYDYYNGEINFKENNHMNNISNFYATLSKDKDGYSLTFFFDIENPTLPFYIDKDTINVIVYNKRDYSMFEFYHFLDSRGIVSGWNPPLSDSEDMRGTFAKIDKNDGSKMYYYLSSLELSDYSDIKSLWFMDGYNNLHFKMDEEVYRKITNIGYYYPGKNKNLPLRIVDVVDFLNNPTIESNEASAFNILSDTYDTTNLFINQITKSEIMDKIGRMELSCANFYDTADSYRAYEDYNVSAFGAEDPASMSALHIVEDGNSDLSLGYEEHRGKIISGYIFDNESINFSKYVSDGDFDGFVSQFNISGLFVCKTELEIPTLQNSMIIEYTPSLSAEYCDENRKSEIDKFLNVYCSYTKDDNGITLYFNYYNFLNSPFVKFVDGGKVSMDIVKGTYLKLKPDEDGLLDLILQFKIYDSNGTLLAYRNAPVVTYRIFNVSDDKPKFLVRRETEIRTDSLVYNDDVSNIDLIYVGGVFYFQDNPEHILETNTFISITPQSSISIPRLEFTVSYDSTIIDLSIVKIPNVSYQELTNNSVRVIIENLTSQLSIPVKTNIKTDSSYFDYNRTYALNISDVYHNGTDKQYVFNVTNGEIGFMVDRVLFTEDKLSAIVDSTSGVGFNV